MKPWVGDRGPLANKLRNRAKEAVEKLTGDKVTAKH